MYKLPVTNVYCSVSRVLAAKQQYGDIRLLLQCIQKTAQSRSYSLDSLCDEIIMAAIKVLSNQAKEVRKGNKTEEGGREGGREEGVLDVQKVLYTAQNVRLRLVCAKSALYSTKCTLKSLMCKKCSIQHKMYTREFDVQKVLYTAQNVHLRLVCPKSALYSTKCTLESSMCKKCSIQHKMYA